MDAVNGVLMVVSMVVCWRLVRCMTNSTRSKRSSGNSAMLSRPAMRCGFVIETWGGEHVFIPSDILRFLYDAQ